MAKIITKWINDDAVNEDKIKLSNDAYLRARNAADNADVNVIKVNASNEIEFATLPVFDGSALATLADIASTFQIQGNWDADTNTPTLVNSTNSTGDEYPLYIVSVAGNTVLDGQDDWRVGDKVYFANGQWFKVDNNDPASTDELAEGVTNLYFTDTRARTAAVVNSTAGNETDQAPSVDAMKAYVATEVSTASGQFNNEIITLAALDITNEYVTLTETPIAGSLQVVPVGGLVAESGVDYEIDAIELDQVNLLGDFLATLEEGDKIMIQYAY